MEYINQIFNKNCLEGLKDLPCESVHCCVTSPPYYGLRNYGTEEQIGLEETPEMFVEALMEVFYEVFRVLRPDGTLWLNLGDSYAAAGKNRTVEKAQAKSTLQGRKNSECIKQINKIVGDLKAKDLIGIPWMVAFALRKAGWYLRQDIIWSKPNPMPESVTDRCTKAHEYIFLLSKSNKYYYDAQAIKTLVADATVRRMAQNIEEQNGSERVPGKPNGLLIGDGYANKKSVWTVSTKPFKEAHFATFPEDLISDCIKAGCPEDGIVLDPFMGAGTTALVARKLNRNYVGFELNKDYIEISNNRLKKEIGLFL